MNKIFPLWITFASFWKVGFLAQIIACAILSLIAIIIFSVGLSFLFGYLVCLLSDITWISGLTQILSGGAGLVLGWFMLPPLMVFIAGFFQEKVIQKIDGSYYSNQKDEKEAVFFFDLMHDIRFLCWSLFLNLLILPFYLLGIGFILSFLLNTYLLGREFFESTVGYYVGKKKAKLLIVNNRFGVYLGGMVFTILSLTPIINFILPICATIWMVHVYQHMQKRISS